MSPKRSSGIQFPTTLSEPDGPADALLGRLRDLEPGDALLLATWQPAAPVPAHLSEEATALLDESLRRVVSAVLPADAVVGSWGARHVLVLLPTTTPTAAARAGRRARRAWKARWNAPVHCSAAAVRGGAGALALAEEALAIATDRRTGGVVLVDAALGATEQTAVRAVTAA
jgi:hypothetical protein